GQIRRVERWMAHRQRRFFRVDLHGRYIEREFGFCFRDEESCDAGYVEAWSSSKRKLDPPGVDSGLKGGRFLADPEGADRLAALLNAKWNPQGAAVLPKAVLRTFQFALPVIACTFQRITAAALISRLSEARGEERETSLSAAQIRSRHRRELPSVEFVGRKRDWYANDGRSDVLIAQ